MYFLLENMCFLRIVKISDVFFRKIGDPRPVFRCSSRPVFRSDFPSRFSRVPDEVFRQHRRLPTSHRVICMARGRKHKNDMPVLPPSPTPLPRKAVWHLQTEKVSESIRKHPEISHIKRKKSTENKQVLKSHTFSLPLLFYFLFSYSFFRH